MATNEVLTRRHLPHWYVRGAVHFVTYRLAGSIPAAALDQLRQEYEERLRRPPQIVNDEPAYRNRIHKQFFASYDTRLDQERTVNWLVRANVAEMVQESLRFHDGKKYHLVAYCIMPNHVHVLLQPREPASPAEGPENVGERPDGQSPLSSIMHSLKSYTANEANRMLNRKGTFWQSESYDHWVRDDDELERIVEYVHGNPVKAGLVEAPRDWKYSSLHGHPSGTPWNPGLP